MHRRVCLLVVVVLQPEFRLSDLFLELGFQKVFVGQFGVILRYLDAGVAQLEELDLLVIPGDAE